MRAEIARFERFDNGKQLSRYCGVTRRHASSGQEQADAGLVKAANDGLRIVLIQAARRLMNCSPHWSALAARLKRKGTPHKVIVAAVAHNGTAGRASSGTGRLVLCRSGYVAVLRQMRQERPYLVGPHLARMPLVVEQDEPLDPANVRLFRAVGQVLHAAGIGHLKGGLLDAFGEG